MRTRPASITPLLLTGRNHHAVGMGANLQEHHLQEARKFADRLADRLLVSAGEPG